MQNNDNEYFLLMDVGGTGIKGCVYDIDGNMAGEYREYPSMADGTKEEIFDNFYNIIQDLGGDRNISKIGFAFPGPFDFNRGISLMQGLNKYDAICGVSIKDELSERDGRLKKTPMLFLHDVEAFALGCISFGDAGNYNPVMCLCIGTGAGSAFIRDGKVLKEPEKGVPQNGWIYNTAFGDGIIDDYLSVRGLRRLGKSIIHEDIDGYELYKRCLAGDTWAMKVYEKFGETVLDAIKSFIDDFEPKALILGGQISKSFAFFGDYLSEFLDSRNIKIILEENTSIRAMQGLLVKLKKL